MKKALKIFALILVILNLTFCNDEVEFCPTCTQDSCFPPRVYDEVQGTCDCPEGVFCENADNRQK